MRFDEFDFDERLTQGIQDAGFVDCTSVQEETFKILKEKRDVLAQSQTGTGKTAAFLLGSFQLMLKEESLKGSKLLVVVPTRELAIQVEREAHLLGGHLDFKIGAFYGGVGYQKQEEQLVDGLDVLVGTPGRLIDFSKSKKIDLGQIGIVVIDEADRLFDMGFAPDITFMLKKMKPVGERITMLYSATLSTRVANLTWEHMREPGEIIIESENVTVDNVQQELYHVGVDEKMSLLLGILKRDKPEAAVIFCNTRGKVYEVAMRLEQNGYNAKFLIGDLPQKKRTQIVDAVKKGEIPFLVATDVAARGLHIEDLPLVVNYDVPNDAENYVHRIGRTARAGKKGRSITLACEEFVLGLNAVEAYIDGKIPVVWAEEDLYEADKSRGMRFRLNDLKRDGTIKDRNRDSRSGRGRPDRGSSGRGRPDRSSSGRGRPDRGNSERGNSNRGRSDGGNSGGARPDRGPLGGSTSNRDGNNNRDRGSLKPSPQVVSAVSQVAGSMDHFDKDKGSRAAKSARSTGKPQRKKTNSPKGNNKGRTDRSYPQKDRPNVEKNINSQSSMDSRLEYYRKKYGEDFKPSNVSETENKPGKGKPSKDSVKSGKGKSLNKRKSPKKTVSKNSENNSNDSKEKVDPPKKKGFLGRIFGK
ncbi:MAG: DEAD/DEAH box helicase [Spirochaetaceae bacterium]|jgi:ATP-dependent RNA helicase RhlB|nr:DEAD/DEAH box helicase [Spirochaetaceae bacterium]